MTFRSTLIAAALSAFFGGGLFFTPISIPNAAADAPEPSADRLPDGTTDLVSWTFESPDSARGWTASHLQGLKAEEGVLSATYSGRDPFFVTPEFNIKPRPGQMVEMRVRTVSRWSGELFFAESHEGPYGGFSQAQAVSWNMINDGQWHLYRIFPNWSNLSQIIKLRLDFGVPDEAMFGKNRVEVDFVRIVDLNVATIPTIEPNWKFTADSPVGWTGKNAQVEKTADGWRLTSDRKVIENDSEEGAAKLGRTASLESNFFAADTGKTRNWLSVTMRTDRGHNATLRFASEQSNSVRSVPIPLALDENPDDFVTYNVGFGGKDGWGGRLFFLEFLPSDDPEALSVVREISIGTEPSGPARIVVLDVGLTEAINRSDAFLPVSVDLRNTGGKTAENLRFRFDSLPEGMTLYADSEGKTPVDSVALDGMEPFDRSERIVWLRSTKPFAGPLAWTITGDEIKERKGSFDAKITPSLNLPKADYVPEPTKLELIDPELEIGALYFPGWAKRSSWERIRPVAPIRKPVLGWYDEGNPEVVDWQIKWALESGISFFLVDWYWNKGNISLDHWVRAFQKARYRDRFKWAMMWANHNGRGSHSVEDQAAVTKYWIENYFNTPEYYRIDDKPVVMIWSVEGMDTDLREIERKKGRDLKRGEGVKILLDLSRKMAVEAGLKGIYFVAMKWPEASTQPGDIEWLADAGFDMTSIYHYMNPGRRTENPKAFDFDQILETSLPWWRARQETGILPFLPNLSTGWDDRPWNNHLVIENRTPEKFRRLCEEMKTFVGESGIKRFALAPLNEWGEGSYAEPNREFGFGMFEALRETFGKKPAEGWSPFYGPSDVGLGPYDLPLEKPAKETSWRFDSEKSSWSPFMGIADFKLGAKSPDTAAGVCSFRTAHRDPALACGLTDVRAKDFGRLKVRMKLAPVPGKESGAASKTTVQLFWGTVFAPITEKQSAHQTAPIDGKFHDLVFDLAVNPLWTGRVTTLRFDPATDENLAVEIETIELAN